MTLGVLNSMPCLHLHPAATQEFYARLPLCNTHALQESGGGEVLLILPW